MRVAIMTVHHAVGSGRYMRDAFRRIGVDVRTLGPSTGSNIWGMRLPPQRAWSGDGDAQAWWPDWRPDLVILMDCSRYHHERYRDVPHVVYGVDNHVYNFRQDGITHYFLAHRRGPAMPAEGDDVTWLPCAYDPVFFTPSPIPWKQRTHDIALIGYIYPQRAQLLEALKQTGVSIIAGAGAVYEDFRDIYHNARISLCLSARGDVGQRVFETAAMRCALLSDPCADFDDLGARGIVLFRDIPEAINSIRLLLAKPEKAEQLIEQSYQWAKPHMWDARAQFITNWFRQRYGVTA